MRGERLKDVRELASPTAGDWPSYFVVTESGTYEYTGQSFIKRTHAIGGKPVQGLSPCRDARIRDVRGDGESAVILLDGMGVIVFDLQHDPFGSEPKSWPQVRCLSAGDANTWKDESERMEPLSV